MTTRSWLRKLLCPKARPLAPRPRIRPTIERLEDRTEPAILTVNSLLDDPTTTSALTLRQAIGVCDAHGQPVSGGAGAVVFHPSLPG
jgi:hypothetical protein